MNMSFAQTLSLPRTVLVLAPLGHQVFIEVRREGEAVGRVLLRGRD